MSRTLGSLPVGALVKDALSTYYGQPIIWKIADKDHEGYPANSTTLITDKIIKIGGFDAKEEYNSNSDRQYGGNNRYLFSNLRQWLNSNGANWFKETYLSDKSYYMKGNSNGYNAYHGEPGFMDNFSAGFRSALLETTLTVAKSTFDKGGSETVQDKFFLPSTTEVGLAEENSIAEGSKLAIFSDNVSRVCNPTIESVTNNTYVSDELSGEKPWIWWLRTPNYSKSAEVRNVIINGDLGNRYAYEDSTGIRPLCNLKSDVLVSDEPDSDGVYSIQWTPITLSDMNVGDIVKIKENGVAVNYLIVHKGLPSDMYDASCDGVWLLRYQTHSEVVWDADGQNDYANSDIKTWLDSTFINTIDSKIREKIKTVKIPYKKGLGNNKTYGVQSGADGLTCKAFLLGIREVGYAQSNVSTMPIDGAKLDYFLEGDGDDSTGRFPLHRRICRDNDNYSNTKYYYLRSPNLNNSKYVFGVCQSYSDSRPPSSKLRARPAFILPPDLMVGNNGLVSINTPPTITSDKTGDLGTLTDGFVCNYTVSDEDEDDVITASIYIDDTLIDVITTAKDVQNTYSLTGNNWLKITNGSHTFKITATDGKATVESTPATFVRNCNQMFVSLVTPLDADDIIKVCSLTVEGTLPSDAVVTYEVTNNALDDAPVWEDCSDRISEGQSYAFKNKTAVNGNAFNFKISVERGASGEGCHITKITGGFE